MNLNDLFQLDELEKKTIIDQYCSEPAQSSIQTKLEMRGFHHISSFSIKFKYPKAEVERILDKYSLISGVDFEKDTIIKDFHGNEYRIGSYNIGPNVSKFLIENEFSKRTRLRDLSKQFKIPLDILGEDLFQYFKPAQKLESKYQGIKYRTLNEDVALDDEKLTLIKEYCSKYISAEEFAIENNFPQDAVVVAIQSSNLVPYKYKESLWREGYHEKLLNIQKQEMLLQMAKNWKSVEQLAKEYDVDIEAVINYLDIEKRRQIEIYKLRPTNKNSVVTRQDMLHKLNNYFINKNMPKYLQKSPLDSNVGYGNTPNSTAGKSLSRTGPRFLS